MDVYRSATPPRSLSHPTNKSTGPKYFLLPYSLTAPLLPPSSVLSSLLCFLIRPSILLHNPPSSFLFPFRSHSQTSIFVVCLLFPSHFWRACFLLSHLKFPPLPLLSPQLTPQCASYYTYNALQSTFPLSPYYNFIFLHPIPAFHQAFSFVPPRTFFYFFFIYFYILLPLLSFISLSFFSVL